MSGEIFLLHIIINFNYFSTLLIIILLFLGYLLSREEGQPGTPEKPLSDLGRVSYHAYWKSVILEYIDQHRNKPMTFEDIGHASGMHTHDIALTFQLLGFIRYIPNNDSIKLGLCVDWNKVDNYMKKLRSRPRLEIDPECLRWTPLLAPTINPFRSPDADGSGEVETEEDTEVKSGSEDNIETETVKGEVTVKPETIEKKPEEPVEITSSGRRRTRPLKYSETTYQTTPTITNDNNRKRRRDLIRKISESNVAEEQDDAVVEEQSTSRRRSSKSGVRRSSRAVQSTDNESNSAAVSRNRRQSVKEPTYCSDSQEEPSVNIVKVSTNSLKKPKKSTWKGRARKRQRSNKFKVAQETLPVAKKVKLDKEQEHNDGFVEPKAAPVVSEVTESKAEEDKPKENFGESSEDSSGEADDEMDVEEADDKTSVASKPATPRAVEENSTDNHTSDMELDSIHMDSPKSIGDKELNENEPVTEGTSAEKQKLSQDVSTDNKVQPEKNVDVSVENVKIVTNTELPTSIKTPLVIDDKDTIIISESDDNNSQSCPLPSPKLDVPTPVSQTNYRPKEVEENESPSKVIPVVSTENAHIVLDAKVREEAIPVKPPVDLIVPKINQMETIVVESDSANSPQTGISPKKNDVSVINESPKQRKSPEKNDIGDRKSEIRKETVIQHQAVDDNKVIDKKTSPNKYDTSIIQGIDQRDCFNQCSKKTETLRIDPYMDTCGPKSVFQQSMTVKEDIILRNDINNRREDPIVSRSIIEPTLQNFQNTLMNTMALTPVQYSYVNHRINIAKESQGVHTEKLVKSSEGNRLLNNVPSDSAPPVISKTTKLEVPNPITSPVISPVIPKVPHVSDINFLPRCQSANAAVSMGLERSDMETNFINSNALQNSLGASMTIVQALQDKSDPNTKPREKSKLRDVRVNSAHSKLEKADKKNNKNETPRSTPEPKLYIQEQNATSRKIETSVPINVINSVAVNIKSDNKSVSEPHKKQDFFKKERAAAPKCDNKSSGKSCSQTKMEQSEPNKLPPKLKYDNELVAKADYAVNQIPNYHSTHAQYQWPHWDPARLQTSWEHNRFLDMKTSDKNYFQAGFNLPHLEQVQKSPQKKDFNLAYSGLYAAAGLPHFKESKPANKPDCKPPKQPKCQLSACDKKSSHCDYQNGPCDKDDKKTRHKKEEPKETKEEMHSLGVYTPDSASNSVHSVQYATCELDVSQLGLESPTSVGSDLASPCSMMHMHPAPSPHLPMMTHPAHTSHTAHKNKNVNNRNASRSAGNNNNGNNNAGGNNTAGGGLSEAQKATMRAAHTPPARHRATPPAHQGTYTHFTCPIFTSSLLIFSKKIYKLKKIQLSISKYLSIP